MSILLLCPTIDVETISWVILPSAIDLITNLCPSSLSDKESMYFVIAFIFETVTVSTCASKELLAKAEMKIVAMKVMMCRIL